ncbi:hypothetical protein LR010_02820 [Candidatus Gracilibacteria bacterium]|nr:hypothetical protein [Candidatus Gracilibacteria bacterium]
MKNLTQYIFIFLILVMLYFMYLVISYKYTEYKIYKYTRELGEINTQLTERIEYAKEVLENKNTKAYKNKVIKSQKLLRGKGEEVIFLIGEKKYNAYTSNAIDNENEIILPQNLLDEKSLIATMTIFQKWIYLIFGKDIR